MSLPPLPARKPEEETLKKMMMVLLSVVLCARLSHGLQTPAAPLMKTMLVRPPPAAPPVKVLEVDVFDESKVRRTAGVLSSSAVVLLTATGAQGAEVVDVVLNPVLRDVTCSVVAALGAIVWLKIWTTLASKDLIDPRLSRKIIHCGSGPLFLMAWPFYSAESSARLIAAVVPAINIVRLAAAGSGGKSDDTSARPLVTAVSRSGERSEVLKGPLIYCVVLFLSTFGWRDSIPSVVAITQMAVGDGVADIVGRRFGKTHKWFFAKDKSYAGSLAFVIGASLATIGLLAWFNAVYIFFGQDLVVHITLDFLLRIVLVSLACAFVELLPGLDDNISVPLAGAILAQQFLVSSSGV